MKPADAPQRVLSFADNPPLSLPMRYFLSAPLFAALAAALLLWQGPSALLTRWSPLTLALTHLLVLGCLSMTMMGALLQMLPVVAGIALPRNGAIGAAVHLGLCAGTLALAAAFWSGQAVLFPLALALLLPSLLLFIGACTVGMWRLHTPGAGAVVAGIRLSLAALLTTVLLGGLLASAFAWPDTFAWPLQRLTDLHAMWGLLGWVGLLVIAVAFQVVPMFMLTEPYSTRLTGSYTTMLFLLLVVASLSSGLSGTGERFHLAILVLTVIGYGLFGATTLYLLARRKRPAADPTTLYWRIAMASLLAALVLWALPQAWRNYFPVNAVPLLLGVLVVCGFALSAVNGMLYKIVPFLAWYHLQDHVRGSGRKMPAINKIIPQGRAQWQCGVHAAALLLLLGACYQPDLLVRPAAALMCLACLGLWLNLCTAARLYWQLRAVPSMHPPVTPTT